MRVTVISMHAIMARADRCVWEGEVSMTTFPGQFRSNDDYFFRFFNRVDEADVRRLASLRYELPSLSVGDVLYYEGRAVRVAGMGFREIDPDELAMASLFDTIRPEPKALGYLNNEAGREAFRRKEGGDG